MSGARGSLLDRCEPKIDFTSSPDGCWLWTAAKSPRSYGVVGRGRVGEGNAFAHRAVWEETVGPIPDGLELDHLCFNPPCVNPDHLELVTPDENKRRIRVHTNGNDAKTHCPQGHPYDEKNTYRRPNGGRGCITCRREASARYEATRSRAR